MILSLANIKGRDEIKKISTTNLLSRFDIEINENTSLMAECLRNLSDNDNFCYVSEKEFNTIVHILGLLKQKIHFSSLSEVLEDAGIALFFCDIRSLTTDPTTKDRELIWITVYKAFVLYLEKGIAEKTPWACTLYSFVSDSLMYYFQSQLLLYSNKRLTGYLN